VVERVMAYMSYFPSCILDRSNVLDVKVKIMMRDQNMKVIENKNYLLPLNLNSGI
jgi:hypothetical protein